VVAPSTEETFIDRNKYKNILLYL